MWSNFNFVNVQLVLERILRHPLLQDVSLETAIQYTVDFLGIVGVPVYEVKEASINVKEYRALLPNDVIAIHKVSRGNNELKHMASAYDDSDTYKTQGNILYTSFKDGIVDIVYKSIPTDDEGFPMIPDNSKFLKALELYIKKEWFTILFDMGKITPAVLQNTQQAYFFAVGQMNNEFTIPSVEEMKGISTMLNTILPKDKAVESKLNSSKY